MIFVRAVCFSLTLAIATISNLSAAQKVSVSMKAQLQASMQTHIDRRLVEGAYLSLDQGTGIVRKLYPTTAHPMILKMGKYYVLCSDFRDKAGKSVNMDFYLAPRGKRYFVFDAVVNDRASLKRLMKAGRVSRVN